MSFTQEESEISRATSLISVAFNVILIFIVSVLANIMYLYHSFANKIALNRPIALITIPDNSAIKAAVTFIFWLLVGALSYIVFIIAKSLLAIVYEEYTLSHYMHRPTQSALISEGTMRVLSWIVLVASVCLLIFTMLTATIPSAKVLFSSFTLINAGWYVAYSLGCVFFMRCIALFSFVIKG